MDVCIYCGAPADTRDHVPPRCFLEEGEATRTTVPACLVCNRRFSMHEQYTIALLAQIGTRDELAGKVDTGGVVDRAFERSPAFEQRFIDRLSVDGSGRVVIEPEVSAWSWFSARSWRDFIGCVMERQRARIPWDRSGSGRTTSMTKCPCRRYLRPTPSGSNRSAGPSCSAGSSSRCVAGGPMGG